MKMNKCGDMFFCIFCILLCIQIVAAYEYPTIKPFVNDFIGLLTPEQFNALDQHCARININTSYEIAVVLINTTDGQDRLEYANRIGEQAGVGKKELSNGLVILWAENNERGIAIAVGRGAETYINDAKAGEIARAARHLFDEGKYYEGMEQIITELEDTIHQRDTTAKGITSLTDGGFNDLIMIFIIFGVTGLIIYIILSHVKVFPRVFPILIGKTSGGGGGFSGSGGGFSGGSFGGGGARG